MVSVDAANGTPVQHSGAALAGGPALVLVSRRRLDQATQSGSGGGFRGLLQRQPLGAAPPPAADGGGALTTRPDVLPAQWGVPTFFGAAPFGPPYELPSATAEWELAAETVRPFEPVNRQARMAQRVHPRGPALQSAGVFLTALYGATPTPRYLGVGLDTFR